MFLLLSTSPVPLLLLSFRNVSLTTPFDLCSLIIESDVIFCPKIIFMAIQLFKGAFYYCEGIDVRFVKNRTDCLEADRRNRWVNRKYNFDNLGQVNIHCDDCHELLILILVLEEHFQKKNLFVPILLLISWKSSVVGKTNGPILLFPLPSHLTSCCYRFCFLFWRKLPQQALMALFVLSSKDGWVNIMYTGLDAVGVDQQPVENYNEWRLLFFISFLLLVAFFVLNMFVGVVVENFHRCREEQEKEERARRAEKRARKLEKRRKSIAFFQSLSSDHRSQSNNTHHQHVDDAWTHPQSAPPSLDCIHLQNDHHDFMDDMMFDDVNLHDLNYTCNNYSPVGNKRRHYQMEDRNSDGQLNSRLHELNVPFREMHDYLNAEIDRLKVRLRERNSDMRSRERRRRKRNHRQKKKQKGQTSLHATFSSDRLGESLDSQHSNS